MGKKITRRELFKDVGTAGAASFLAVGSGIASPAVGAQAESAQLKDWVATPSNELMARHRDHLEELVAGEMVVGFDRRYGSIASITRKGDPLGTNFIGNEVNTPGVDPSDSRFTGDVVTTLWDLLLDWKDYQWGPNMPFQLSGKWKRELTGKSDDIREIAFENGVFTVKYQRPSRDDEGVRSFSVAMSFRAGEGSSLIWDVELQNITNHVLEIGELAFPLMVNDDYAELYVDPKTGMIRNDDESRTPLMQKLIHEQKVLVHHFVAGHSSYALIQRPLGDPPYLLFHPLESTSFECVYRDDSSFARNVQRWGGPDLMAVHTWATKNIRDWRGNPWVNGHTSLVLEPGEKRSYKMRFAFVDSYDAIRDELYRAGNLGIRILPSMVVQEGTDAYVELNSKSDVDQIDFLSDNITVKEKKRADEKTLLTLSFKGRGQKSLKLNYGAGRWTNLHFYCIEDIEGLLKARGRFIVDREFYENPKDPYHRHHMFLPFDHRVGSTYLDADRVWEVGGSDETGFSEALFLAEKNVYYPSQKEIATLEAYVSDCLFKYIQNPETYTVRASLYYKERYPSSPWSHWTKERSEATFRSYNYPHPANIYHALYRIGKQYGLVTHRAPQEYLKMSYNTCLKWFNMGPWRHIGLMGGSNALNILRDIKEEGWDQEYQNLLGEMKKCNQVFLDDPYPYSSELLIDQTAHEQVYFFTRYFGNTAKNQKTVQVLKALRGGNQPVWFRYGNDKRRDVACWYNASLNGMALLQAFEDSGDPQSLIKGYPGVMSVMKNVLPDGMGYNFFICTPGVFDHEPRITFESGQGLYGFLKSAKSYVIRDESFGLIGCGCRVESANGQVTVYPKDGLKKRVRFVEQKIDVEAMQGEFDQLALASGGQLELQMSDSTGLVKTAELEVKGLQPGSYRVRRGRSSARVQVADTLKLSMPMAQARMIRIERV